MNVPGASELVVVAFVAFLVLGPSRLPEAANQLGKLLARLRDSSRVFQSHISEVAAPIIDLRNQVRNSASDLSVTNDSNADSPASTISSGVSTPSSLADDAAGLTQQLIGDPVPTLEPKRQRIEQPLAVDEVMMPKVVDSSKIEIPSNKQNDKPIAKLNDEQTQNFPSQTDKSES